MSDLNSHYCIKMLHHHGAITRTDVTSRFAGISGSDIGRADIFAAIHGKAFNVECKQGSTGFMMSDWRLNQRMWAKWTSSFPHSIEYMVYLTIGKHPATYNPEKYLPKKSWLIPFKAMLEVEEKIIPYQKTLVMKVKSGMAKQIQEQRLDAITLLKDYELEWAGANSLVKPEWMLRTEQLEEAGKTQQVIERSKMYGSFWVVPKTHIFHTMFIANTAGTQDQNV